MCPSSTRLSIHSFVDRDMFVRYLGGGVGHGGNTADMETPTEPNDDPEDDGDRGSEGGDEAGGWVRRKRTRFLQSTVKRMLKMSQAVRRNRMLLCKF